jgi:actin-related protein 5
LCGGNSYIPNLEKRVYSILRSISPYDIPISVKRAEHPTLDAWKGMCKVLKNYSHNDIFFSKKEWEEKGTDYLLENDFSNRLYI